MSIQYLKYNLIKVQISSFRIDLRLSSFLLVFIRKQKMLNTQMLKQWKYVTSYT